MSSSNYYWSRKHIQGFGKMWFLIIPQEADSPGGGASLLGSVVNEVSKGPFGTDYPEPIHLTTPQLILSAMETRRGQDGIPSTGDLVLDQNFPGASISVESEKLLKTGIGNFPGIPISLSIDYSKAVKISVNFGANTRKKLIPRGFLSGLKNSVGDDDSLLSTSVNIDKEFIIHEILLTDQYSVEFESTTAFGSNFEASIDVAKDQNSGVNINLDRTTMRKVSVEISDGKEYLIALKNIDWDNL